MVNFALSLGLLQELFFRNEYQNGMVLLGVSNVWKNGNVYMWSFGLMILRILCLRLFLKEESS